MNILAAIIKWLTDRIEKIEFTRIDHVDGGFYICEKGEGFQIFDPADGPTFASYKVTSVFMTRHQFENLPEFNGF